ncbi:MAG TPA: TerC/Alx family metal homeostasis membrane protein [Actinomycetaceae bacterium]|nr:TerC/Alx family metal homeostasis membrane protein [Actinomycetaceae bacterium]
MLGHGYLPVNFEIVALIVMVGIITFDLLMVLRRPHVPSFKECIFWVGLYVSLALIFGVILFLVADPAHQQDVMVEFYAGWLTEYSLSIDNLFIFIIVLANFRVPPKNQQKVLMLGILIALILRAIMIILGAALINEFAWVFYIFGAFLIYTAIKLVLPEKDTGDEYEEGKFISFARKRLNVGTEWDEGKWRTVDESGKSIWTPMILVVIALGGADLMFALDSIPAIFGITQDPFIVFATNLFALMGLRQLYFLLGGLLDRLVYLPYGLSFILGFIGVKLILHAMHENNLPFINNGQPIEWGPSITSIQSLLVIVVTLVLTTVLSLTVGKSRAEAKEAEAAELPAPPEEVTAGVK